MKLKTVSRLTMLFALLCLGAFVAGRPPATAARAGIKGGQESKRVSSQDRYVRLEPMPVRSPSRSPQAN